MEHEKLNKLASRFHRIASEQGKINILYLVHPSSITEQSKDERYVKPYLDKWSAAINSFDGIVIVTLLKRKVDYESFGSQALERKGCPPVENFVAQLKGNSKVILLSEPDNNASLLGNAAMKEKIDDLFLEDRLGTITLAGCFDCGHWKMCVHHTFDNLEKNYPGQVLLDENLTVLAGPVFVNEDGSIASPSLKEDDMSLASKLRRRK